MAEKQLQSTVAAAEFQKKQQQKRGVLSFRLLEPALFMVGFEDLDSPGQQDRIAAWRARDPGNNVRVLPVVYHPIRLPGVVVEMLLLNMFAWKCVRIRLRLSRIM